ncbi:MAG: hypothetical protein ABIO70_07560 [Pseudomonadota bacterium]
MEEARRLLEQLLRRKRVLDLPSIARATEDRSRRSLFRDLVALGYLTSYTHAGRYYALTDVPQFDEHGLWFFQGIGFTRAGTLKRTLVELVGAAEAGHTHNELQSLLHVRVHNTLLGLVRDQLIGRERIEKWYLYVSAATERAAAQVARRRTLLLGAAEAIIEVPAVLVIEVLLELVRAGPVLLAPSVVAKRLGARGISATMAQVEQVFAGHGLVAGKKTPR